MKSKTNKKGMFNTADKNTVKLFYQSKMVKQTWGCILFFMERFWSYFVIRSYIIWLFHASQKKQFYWLLQCRNNFLESIISLDLSHQHRYFLNSNEGSSG